MENNKNIPAQTTENLPHKNPFENRQMSEHVNAGTIEIEVQRAVAEAQGKLIIAKKFPRKEATAFSNMITSCSRFTFADQAMYTFPRGNKSISGPSIRMAEELARNWGNIEFGTRELSRREGESEMEAYAWDLEANNYRSIKFTVKHIRDKADGGAVLTSERDIYEMTANMGGRRMRACLLAILPADFVDEAVIKCQQTLAAGRDKKPLEDSIREMLIAFKSRGINSDMIEARIGKKVTEIFIEDLVELATINNSIAKGDTKASEWFGGSQESLNGESKPNLKDIKDKADQAKKVEEIKKEKSKTEKKADNITTTPGYDPSLLKETPAGIPGIDEKQDDDEIL